MQKRLALLVIAIIIALTLVPAYYPPDDEALRQTASLNDVYSQLFSATGAFYDFSHHQGWTGVSLSWDISYSLPQCLQVSTGTRAPPA